MSDLQVEWSGSELHGTISARLDIAIGEAIQQHTAAYRQNVIDLEETLSALRRVSSALLGDIPDPDERSAMLCVLVDELQRAAPWQSSERGQEQLRADDVRHSPSMADAAEGGGRCEAAVPLVDGRENATLELANVQIADKAEAS